MESHQDYIKKNGNFGGFLKSAILIFATICIFFFVPLKIIYEEKTQTPKPQQKEIQNINENQVSIFQPDVPAPPIEEEIIIKQAGAEILLEAHQWVPQTYNNCGPATASMVLQKYGYSVSQSDIKKALRTSPDDRNVFLYEIRDYLKNNYEVESKIMRNGSIETLKLLLANNFYVVLEAWIHPNEDIGHFSILRGYDDKEGVLIVDDSYLGLGTKFKYDEFDRLQWKAFNRRYMPVYKKEDEKILKKIIGEDWDEAIMHAKAAALNTKAVEENPEDAYAWFNIGASQYALGEYQKSWEAFEKSENIGWPQRMLWYQIYPVQTANAVGRYEDALRLANQGLRNNNPFAELHYESAVAYKELGNMESAKKELNLTLKYDPNYQKAKDLLDLL